MSADRQRCRAQDGLAYVAILMLLMIASTLGLAFAYSVGMQTSLVEARPAGMQADYLAESAANHALWRLLNEPGFPDDDTVYHMGSLAGGRYGYKVRPPTSTTFTAVATVGAVGDQQASQSYVTHVPASRHVLAYDPDLDTAPGFRRLVGASWVDPAATVDLGVDLIHHMVLEGCPIRDEVLMGTLDDSDRLGLSVWDGTGWGPPVEFTTSSMKTRRCFDLAYESLSGNALVVGRYDSSTTVYYNVWNGTAWESGTPLPAFDVPSGTLSYLTMASHPGLDVILIGAVTSNSDLQLYYWNGAAFSDLGVLETSVAETDAAVAEIVFEQQSGEALVVWSGWNDDVPYYRVWDGTALSAEGRLPSFGSAVYVFRAAADPVSDHVVVAGLDKNYDINLAVWDGSSWTDSREIETTTSHNTRQVMDLAWETTGEDLVVAWTPWNSGGRLASFRWQKGTTLAKHAVETGPDFGNPLYQVRLLAVAGTEKLLCAGASTSKELRYALWNGNRLVGNPDGVQVARLGGVADLSFDLAEPGVAPTGGGLTEGNRPPLVDAGVDMAGSLSAGAALDGTVSDDGLPSPPATVDTLWTAVRGPGAVAFTDATMVDTTARFTDVGVYVLRLQADDGEAAIIDQVSIEVVDDGCNPDYQPNAMLASFNYAAVTGLTFFPEGMVYNGVTSPAGGSYIMTEDNGNIPMVDPAGNLLTAMFIPGTAAYGVTLVESGTWADHLAVVTREQPSANMLRIVSLGGVITQTIPTDSFGSSAPMGIAYVDTTASGLYADHLAVLDGLSGTIHIVDQAGIPRHSIDVSSVSMATGIEHLPGTDFFLVTGMTARSVFKVDLDGNLLAEYDTGGLGLGQPQGITFDPTNCDHVIADPGGSQVGFLNLGGPTGDIFVQDIAMGSRKQGKRYYAQATVWVRDEGGTDVAGATVTVQWSGAVTGTSQGVTAADGRVMLESPGKRDGGTFTCQVTDVVKAGRTYNPALNVETSDTITAP